MQVSVIVPMRNAAAHIGECLASVRAQPFHAYEVICVDDASIDGTAALVERLAARDNRIKLVRLKEPGGVSAARNAGLARAVGEFILFLDADDLWEGPLLEHAVSRALEQDAQMVVFGFWEYYARTGRRLAREMCEEQPLYASAFSLAAMQGVSTALVTPNVWRILFRRSFIEGAGLRFHEGLRTSEDLAFIYEALSCVERISLLDERFYLYRRDGGVTLTRGDRGLDGYTALDCIRAFAEGHGAFGEVFQRHFANLVLDVAEYAMNSAATCAEFEALYEGYGRYRELVDGYAGQIAPRYREIHEALRSKRDVEYLFNRYASARDALEELRSVVDRGGVAPDLQERCADLEHEIERLRGSWAFRVGRAVTFVPSRAKELLRRRRAAGDGGR